MPLSGTQLGYSPRTRRLHQCSHPRSARWRPTHPRWDQILAGPLWFPLHWPQERSNSENPHAKKVRYNGWQFRFRVHFRKPWFDKNKRGEKPPPATPVTPHEPSFGFFFRKPVLWAVSTTLSLNCAHVSPGLVESRNRSFFPASAHTGLRYPRRSQQVFYPRGNRPITSLTGPISQILFCF